MRLGLLTVLYSGKPLEEVLDKLVDMGVGAVELGTGGFPGNAHCDPDELLADESKARALKASIEGRDMIISALSQHGNPIHPDEGFATTSHETWRKTARLANLLEVPVVNGFSGCPGDGPNARYPNWITCAWPNDFPEMLEWQWNEVVIPYWAKEAEFAREMGVKIGIEMHPGFVVYNPETTLRLREAAGPEIGANFDPSHLVWQGIDPVVAIKELGAAGAMHHMHAKDTYVDPVNTARNGVLDTKSYTRILDRSWSFRTVGYGTDEKLWRDMMSAMRMVGYDYVMSIEHEDGLLSVDEGLSKAIEFLRGIMFTEAPTADMYWA